MSKVRRLGVLVEHVHWDCMDQWRMKHAPHSTLADLLAGDILQIEEQVIHYPGGRVHIVCTITGKRVGTSESYFFRCQRIAPAEYIVKASSFDLN
jgi:hypothetical protein